MSRPNTTQPTARSTTGTLSTARPLSSSQPATRRAAGGFPGLAHTASALRQGTPSSTSGVLSNLPAHIRSSTAPRIPSPLGKGTPSRPTQPKQSLPARTSKTTQRHVLLPEEPQTKPLPASLHTPAARAPPRRSPSSGGVSTLVDEEEPGSPSEHDRTEAEKLTKSQREDAGLPRLTAYATAEGYRMKLLQAFLKREHGCGVVRVFDDAVYAVYNLPLLPGYGAGTRVRSSPAVKSPGGVSLLERMTEAEELGYHDGFFPTVAEDTPGAVSNDNPNEYLLSMTGSPTEGADRLEGMEGMEAAMEENQRDRESRGEDEEIRERDRERERSRRYSTLGEDNRLEVVPEESSSESTPTIATSDSLPAVEGLPDHTESESTPRPRSPSPPPRRISLSHPISRRRKSSSSHSRVADVVFFAYGVTVFFGLSEREEREILDDCYSAGAWIGTLEEDCWEIESCHYEYMKEASYPRIYNDMFTFVSHSHLLKLSVSHAIAQSTKLSVHESAMQDALALTVSFPKELADTGELSLTRREALKITGRLFRLRMDVNLSTAILDTPELFWSEASLLPLYEAIRDYLETGQRVQLLNDRLAVSGELLEIIHGYIDQGSMHRITWIVIILIVAAVIVAIGEVTARIVYFATKHNAEAAFKSIGMAVLPRVPMLSLSQR